MQRGHQLTVTSVTVSGSTSLARHGCYIDEIGSCAYDRPKKGQACAGDGSRPGRIAHTTFLGPYRHLAIQLESGEVVTAQTAAAATFHAAENVQVSWDPADELRFPA